MTDYTFSDLCFYLFILVVVLVVVVYVYYTANRELVGLAILCCVISIIMRVNQVMGRHMG